MKNEGEGERRVLKREGVFTIWWGGGGWASRWLTISIKILKLIWKYFHLVLESYGKTLMMSWQKYINVCFDKNYMYIVDNNTRNIYNSAHHWLWKAGPKRRVPQQPMKQILHNLGYSFCWSWAPKVTVLGNK